MKNVLMIGDSWGVPYYGSHLDLSSSDHTEYQLKNLGYNVINFSLNGSNPLETILYALHALNKKPMDTKLAQDIQQRRELCILTDGSVKMTPEPKYHNEHIDWIVWFHTENVRCFVGHSAVPYLTLHEMYINGCHIAYRAFAELQLLCGAKTAVIGGQAAVDPLIYSYITPNYVIEDWRAQILKQQLPKNIALSKLELIDQCYTTKQEKLEILTDHEKLQLAMLNRDLFPDACHPGKPHRELAQQLHQVFQNYQ